MGNGFLNNIFGFLVEVVHAQTQISVGGTSGAGGAIPSPQETIVNIYNFALMIGGILAFGMIVYGAVRYTLSGGSPSGQSEARDIITQALLGLLLLVGVFIVLNLVNPELTRLSLPELGKIEAPKEARPPADVGSLTLTQENAMAQLGAAGISVAGPLNLAGLRQSTVNEAIRLKQACGCEIVITSATGGQHASGKFDHASGYKLDLRATESLTNYITSRYTELPPRSNGDRVFRAPSGTVYVWETNRPANPPPGWAPHWDVQVVPGG